MKLKVLDCSLMKWQLEMMKLLKLMISKEVVTDEGDFGSKVLNRCVE